MHHSDKKQWAISLLLGLLLISTSLAAQPLQYTFSGKVIETDSKQPILGANVKLDNTVVGARTDGNGRYAFITRLTPGTYSMTISYIGFKRKVVSITLTSDNQSITTDIELEANPVRSEEVVVTGTAGETSKKEVASAISTVTLEDIQNGAPLSIDQALQGKVAGALVNQNSGNPGGSISIQLRGPNTLLGNSDPLYIIDGVILSNDRPQLLNLGGYVQNRLVDINPNDIERIEVIKGAAGAAIYGARANNGVVQIFTKRGSSGEPRIEFTTRYNVDQIRRTLPINTYPIDFSLNPNSLRPAIESEKRYDYQDEMFQNAVGTEQYLSVSGGSGNTNYFLSGTYFGNQGIIRGTSAQRGGVRGNLDQVLNRWAKISMNLNYNYFQSQDVANNATSGNDGVLVGFILGNPGIDPRPNAFGDYPVTRAITGVGVSNPLEVIDRFRYTQVTNRIVGSARLDITPFKGFAADAIFGYDTYTQNGIISIPPGNTSFDSRLGFQRNATQTYRQVNTDLNARYNVELSKWLRSTTAVGGTMQYDNTGILSGQTNITTPNIQTVGAGTQTIAGESRDIVRVIYGAYIQQTFGISEKLFLTAAVRADAASVFGPSERWQYFPKLSAAYSLSDEAFWKKSSISKTINSLKLRTALGFSGGLSVIGAFDRFTNYNPTSYDGKPAIVPSTLLGATGIRPERQRQWEVGTDIGLFNDRVGIEFTYYNSLLTDLLIRRNLAPSSGFSQQLDNVGTQSNKGWELGLRTVPVKTRDFQWDFIMQASANRNLVIDTRGGNIALGIYGFSSAINGQPAGVFFTSGFKRDENGNILRSPEGVPLRQLDANGAVLNKIIGDPNPDWIGSFINQFTYKSVSLRLQVDVLRGRDVLNFTSRNGLQNGVLAGYGDVLRGTLPLGYYTNPNFATQPENPGVFRILEYWVEDGSYVKIREASLFYNFSNVLGIRNGQIGVIGRNLFSFDNYSGYDPELNAFARQGIPSGGDDTETPIPRSFSVALRINF
jgi:TonB-dependent starch-binding outer membrane protein SusC